MRYVELPPPAALSHVIRCVWLLRGRAGAAAEPVVPDGRAEIIIHVGEPFSQVEGGVARRQAALLVSGQLTRPLHLAPSREPDVIGIRFRTAAARALLRADLHELADRVMPLGEVRPRLAAALEDAARRAGDPASRARAVASVIGRAIRNVPAPAMARAVALLDRSPVPVAEVAQALGLTRRTLERRFLAEVGLPPRTLWGVLRFRRAFRTLSRAPAGSWARVAAECGYYDQAHMTREFKRFAGAPPSAFFTAAPTLAPAFLGGPDDGPAEAVSHSS